ncbi:MAG: mechanosensitive ion channel family protein [Nitrospira sp.]|nr:mechanosensitive ion channel family protein [Nitrospira sp.]
MNHLSLNMLSGSWFAWTKEVDERLVYTAILVIAFMFAMRVGEWAAQRTVTDEHWRYTIRKLVRYTAIGIFLVSMLGIWAQRLQGLLLILGATGAGFAIALAPVIVSIAGWALIISANLYKVGDRVQLGGVIGDVTDVGILRTSLLEIGNWVQADQLTGRVVALSNAVVFKDPVFNYTQGAPYIWDEFTVPISYSPHWERAQSIMLNAVADYTHEVAEPAKAALQHLPGMSLIGSPDTKTQVYVTLTEHWVACTLRYTVHARSRRTVKHQLQVQVLKALTGAGIEIASPALSVVRYPAERTWKEEA